MLKKLLVAGLLVSASTSAWAQSGQLGANQIWGNPTAGSKPSQPSNVGSFLTQGTGVTITGTPKATIGLATQITAGGPTGSATQTPVLTYNAQGQLTAVTLATIAPPFTAVTGSLACSQHPALTGVVTTVAGNCATSFGNANANTVLSNWSGSPAAPVFNTWPACAADGAHALVYINGTGLQCGTLTTGGTVTSVTCFGTAITTAGTCTTAATKSDEQTGTSTTAVVTPSQQQQHDSAAKAWVMFAGASGTINASYNVSGVTRTSAGLYTVSFTTAFANANYACNVTPTTTSGTGILGAVNSTLAGSAVINTFNLAGSAGDPTQVNVVCFGRQ